MSKKRKPPAKHGFKKVKQKAIRMLITIGIISSLAIIAYGIWTAKHIFEPISTMAISTQIAEKEANKEQIKFYELTLNSEEFIINAALTLIDTHEKTLKTITIPQNTAMHLPYGLDQFKLASLYKISALESAKDLNSLVKQTLIEYFGVPSEKLYIRKTNEKNPQPFTEWITNPQILLRLIFNREWTQKTLITPQTTFDLIVLANTIHTIPKEFRTEINILEYGIGYEETTRDGSTIIMTDTNKLDAYIKKSFQNIEVMNEKANIHIENGTQTPGLASNFARAVKNIGGIIIDISNSETQITQTQIIINDPKWKDSATLAELQRMLDKIEIITENNLQKADIKIKLGDNYAQIKKGYTTKK